MCNTPRSHVLTHSIDMFVLLLVAAQVAAEWVEIAQHQRRAGPSRRVTFSHDGVTESNKIYANYSLTESSWPRSTLSRIPSFGSVTKVQLPGKEKDIFSIGLLPTSENGRYETMGPVRAPNIKIRENIEADKTKEKLIVSNFGNMNETNIRLHNPSQNYHFGNKRTTSETPMVFNANGHIIEKNKYREIVIRDGIQNTSETDYKHDVSDANNDNSKEVQLDKEGLVNTNTNFKVSENQVKNELGTKIESIDKKPSTTSKTSLKKQNFLQVPNSAGVKQGIAYKFDKEINTQIKIENATETHESLKRVKTKFNNYSNLNQFEREDLNLDANTKTNTVDVIWKLMKVVTDNISQNTRRSFKSKITYLEDLRNNIIANIAERIEQMWPDDVVGGAEIRGARRRRAARGHVEFPSSESALMTISFLTFAVFLIKLVLQVIHTYKNKTMMLTPAVVAAVGRAAASLQKQARP